ncbi:MAG: hypothetical protein PHS73_02520 [Candidatus Peribacteraceae bacterium]|nr:hypothetical protein [Candidatus Peribacteraceae bacterium]
MPADQITEHHCVPHSFDGAGSKVNLAKISEREHSNFHQTTGHAPPDFFLRRFLIGSIAWADQRNRSLAPGVYQDVLSILTPDDWRSIYQSGTFIVPHTAEEGHALRTAKAAFHLAWYLDRERSLTMDQIGLLGIHKLLPLATAQEMQGVHHFFGKDRPHVLMRTFLLDGQSNGELKWVKPMRDEIRQALLKVLRNAKLEYAQHNGATRKIFDLLLDHHERLEQCSGLWQPQLRDHAGTLKRLADEHRK